LKKPLVALVVLFVLGVSAAFVAGARVGVDEFLYADAQYRASILAWQLAALRAGKPEAVVERMEEALDSELAAHGRHLESRLAWLWPDLKPKDESAIREAVDYRLSHPFKEPDSDGWVKQYRDKVLTHYR
jgi:hypothetical protein